MLMSSSLDISRSAVARSSKITTSDPSLSCQSEVDVRSVGKFVSGLAEVKTVYHLFVNADMTPKLFRILTFAAGGRVFKCFLSEEVLA